MDNTDGQHRERPLPKPIRLRARKNLIIQFGAIPGYQHEDAEIHSERASLSGLRLPLRKGTE